MTTTLPPDIHLRPITGADRSPLYEIHRRAMHDYVAATWGWHEEVQREFWTRTAHDGVQVIEVDGNLAGFLDVARRPDHVDVVNMELDPAYQGRGIGTAILRPLISEAARGGLSVRLQVLKANPRAMALYERMGLQATGETSTHILMARQSLGTDAGNGI